MNPTTDPAKEIGYLCRAMKTPQIAELAGPLAAQARTEHWSYEQYLAAVLGRQVATRTANGNRLRIAGAHFPQIKTLEDFDPSVLAARENELLAHLATTTFVPRTENVVLLGPPGTGKTHLAIALGICAANPSYPVFFDTATGWITRLLAAHNTGTLEKELRRLRRYRVLIIDEVGYIPFEAEAANLFFQLIANRYEHGTVIVTSNLAFSQWGHTLGDDVIAAATIDRLIHHAHVLTMDGESYRTRRYTTEEGSNFTRR